jgi:hypothetical protein
LDGPIPTTTTAWASRSAGLGSFGDDDCFDYYTGPAIRGCARPPDWDTLPRRRNRVPVALQWNFWLTDVISVFGEPGLALGYRRGRGGAS